MIHYGKVTKTAALKNRKSRENVLRKPVRSGHCMAHKKWSLDGLHKPICVHGCVALRHAPPGVAERFLADLREAGEHVTAHPEEMGSMAPVQGMAATLPLRGMVGDLLKKYLDLIFKA